VSSPKDEARPRWPRGKRGGKKKNPNQSSQRRPVQWQGADFLLGKRSGDSIRFQKKGRRPIEPDRRPHSPFSLISKKPISEKKGEERSSSIPITPQTRRLEEESSVGTDGKERGIRKASARHHPRAPETGKKQGPVGLHAVEKKWRRATAEKKKRKKEKPLAQHATIGLWEASFSNWGKGRSTSKKKGRLRFGLLAVKTQLDR